MTHTNFGRGRALAVAACLLAGSAMAAEPAHVRGTIGAVDGHHVTIATNDGQSVTLTLGDDWKVGGVAAATLADIKPGSFIGTANVAGPDGSEALEVVVFPEAMRGAGEGDRGWDLKPKSSMTNATVAQKVEGVSGPTVTLTYKGGEKKVTIPPSTPIVTLVAATEADVKPGVKVFAVGPLSPDGRMLTGGRLVVGQNGVAPPM